MNIKELFSEGYTAYSEMLNLTDNPYTPTSLEAAAWQDGWYCADGDDCERNYE